MTARYIEFDEFDVLNFGCGSAVFDFETGVFDWVVRLVRLRR